MRAWLETIYFFTFPLELSILKYRFRSRFYTEFDQAPFITFSYGPNFGCRAVPEDEIFFAPNQYEVSSFAGDSALISWDNYDFCVDEFILYEGENGFGRPRTEWQRINGLQNQFVIGDLDPQVIYYFWVTATFQGKESTFDCPIEIKYQGGNWVGKLILPE